MRPIHVGAVLGLVLLIFAPAGAIAGQSHGPTGQQAKCAASGGTFSMGYEADTYVCVTGQGRSVETCRFGKSDPNCSTEDGPSRKRSGQQGGGKSAFGLGIF
jgi:hypothetical protein